MDEYKRDYLVGVVLVLLCSVLWGGMHVLTKTVIEQGVSPTEIVAFRQFISGLVVAVFSIYLYRKSLYKNSWAFVYDKDTLVTFVSRGLAAVFYVYALMYLTATTTIVFYKLSCVFSLLFALYFINKKPKVISLGIAIVGVMLVTLGAITAAYSISPGEEELNAPIYAYSFALLAPLLWAAFAAYSEKHEDTSLKTSDLHVRSAYLSQVLILSAFIPLLVHVIVGQETTLSIILLDQGSSKYLVANVAVIGFISGVVAILYFEAVKRISGVLVSAILAAEIVATLLFEVLVYNMSIDLMVILSIAGVIIGIYLVSKESGKLRLEDVRK